MTTVTIDVADDDAAHASLAQLDPGQRDRMLRAARRILSAENDAAILTVIRAHIAERYPEADTPVPVGVVFPTGEWEDGFFLAEEGFVLLADGQIDEVHFDGLDPLFSKEFGIRGRHFTAAVDLRTGEVDGDTDHDCTEDSVRARFATTATAS